MSDKGVSLEGTSLQQSQENTNKTEQISMISCRHYEDDTAREGQKEDGVTGWGRSISASRGKQRVIGIELSGLWLLCWEHFTDELKKKKIKEIVQGEEVLRNTEDEMGNNFWGEEENAGGDGGELLESW